MGISFKKEIFKNFYSIMMLETVLNSFLPLKKLMVLEEKESYIAAPLHYWLLFLSVITVIVLTILSLVYTFFNWISFILWPMEAIFVLLNFV